MLHYSICKLGCLMRTIDKPLVQFKFTLISNIRPFKSVAQNDYMVNGMLLYDAFLVFQSVKAARQYAPILIHLWHSLQEQLGIQYFAERHFNMQTEGARNWTCWFSCSISWATAASIQSNHIISQCLVPCIYNIFCNTAYTAVWWICPQGTWNLLLCCPNCLSTTIHC